MVGWWRRYRSMPGLIQLGLPAFILAVLIGVLSGGDEPAERTAAQSVEEPAPRTDAEAEDERAEAAREERARRRRARVRRARAERAREARARRARARRAQPRRERRLEERRQAAPPPPEEPEPSESCHPSYEGACLDPNVSDYDCAGGEGDGPEYVEGPVTVTGPDPFDLDRDRDGVGCQS